MTVHLPDPSDVELAHQQQVNDYIIEQMKQAGGCLSFAQFMQASLYAAGLGYYQSGSQKFGRGGDFVTAPELTPLFAYCLAEQCRQVLQHLSQEQVPAIILEFGAGSGRLAVDLLTKLENLDSLPQQYWILEPSADLRQSQQQLLQQHCPKILSQIKWLDSLPTAAFNGIIIANEVMDAMPVERFYDDGISLQQLLVAYQGGEFVYQQQPADQALANFAEQKLQPYRRQWQTPYCSEVNLMLPAWVNSLSEILKSGLALLIDYGYSRHEYYHPQRCQGTLMCYYKHHGHDNPLILSGLQDISAHVDFTLLAEGAIAAHFELAGFNHQAAFLLACGLPAMLPAFPDQQQAIRKLTLPSEMGEAVKVMALTKELSLPLLGFISQDRRQQL